MAVRNFDVTSSRSDSLTLLEKAPLRRRDVRQSKQRWALLGAVSLLVPFVAVLIVLGVSH